MISKNSIKECKARLLETLSNGHKVIGTEIYHRILRGIVINRSHLNDLTLLN